VKLRVPQAVCLVIQLQLWIHGALISAELSRDLASGLVAVISRCAYFEQKPVLLYILLLCSWCCWWSQNIVTLLLTVLMLLL
jgi:hypothetical protein